jgi:hypothetical protein
VTRLLALATAAAITLLPSNVIVSRTAVSQFFPEVTRTLITGANSTATGTPKATRSVVYANAAGSKKVTISVDQYGSVSEAMAAYKQAVRKSKIPGMRPLSVPKVGQRAFAGTVTVNGEIHIGLGTVDGVLVVGTTPAGYDATANNTARLVSLTRKENAAKAALFDGNDQDR